MTESDPIGPIEISVPAVASLSRVLRLAASGLASLAQRNVDVIEDIKIAVSEVFLALIEHGAGHTITVSLAFADETFSIIGRTRVDAFDLNHPDLILCRTVLAGVCARHSIDATNGFAEILASVGSGSGG